MAVTSLMVAGVHAGDSAPKSFEDSANLTLDQLVNIQVTSVSKKETSLNQSPAAIFVITQEDISRLGITSLPEALRLAPGMDVAQVNSSDWAVSSRGFNNQFANKLLVMIDGRSIYDPGFGGVFWEMQDLVLEDLDRIEVIRGPGGTLWGANAVNGVININTKSAKETQGLLISAGGGTELQPLTSLRYGGQFTTNLFYRVNVQYANNDGFVDSNGNETPDARNILHGGGRLDWEPVAGDRFTLQGDHFQGDFGDLTRSVSLMAPNAKDFSAINRKTGDNVLARWTHDFSDSSQLTLQGYYDHTLVNEAPFRDTLDVYDLDLQHRFALGERQDIVWGAGVRYWMDDVPPSFDLTFTPERNYEHVLSAFVQDDVSVIKDRLHLILGSKFEHNSDTGFEVQPSGRLLWIPSEKQTFWGAMSRAVRTPSRADEDILYNQSVIPPSPPGSPLPLLVSLYGNPNFHSEELIAYELGYRIEPTPKLSFDLATFYNVYHDLNTSITGTPFFEAAPVPHVVIPQLIQNGGSANTYGAELSAQWQVTEDWKLMGSYSWLHMRLTPSNLASGDSPQHQFQLHSYLNLTRAVELNASLFYVSQLANADVPAFTHPIPAYTRVDLGLVWRPNKAWELGIWGQNLFNDQHLEFGSQRTPVLTEIPRSIFGKVTWRF
ncbi:MAG: TonB-dependent receptor, plug [Pedosphaera sp.]|nr:TonB-dependent receptor, plug [Pedosphaera sp.]